MIEKPKFDLEERCLTFAKDTSRLLQNVPRSITNTEHSKQLARSSGSIGANYLEANAALGHKDFVFRTRIARKEAKETQYWLHLLNVPDSLKSEHAKTVDEALQLIKILSTIITNVSRQNTTTPSRN